MILLQTLSRLHVCATLAGAQMLGSIVVIIARATAPDKVSRGGGGGSEGRMLMLYFSHNQVGPGPVFPNPALWDWPSMSDPYNPLTVSWRVYMPSLFSR